MKIAFKDYDALAREWVRRCIVATDPVPIGEGHTGGREGNRWRMTFQMCSIYSYGHWPMAVYVLAQKFFLYRTDTHSHTTSRQQHAVRSAIRACAPDVPCVCLPYDWWVNPDYLGEKVKAHNDALLEKAVRCRIDRTRKTLIDQAAAMSEQVQLFQRLSNQGANQ